MHSPVLGVENTKRKPSLDQKIPCFGTKCPKKNLLIKCTKTNPKMYWKTSPSTFWFFFFGTFGGRGTFRGILGVQLGGFYGTIRGGVYGTIIIQSQLFAGSRCCFSCILLAVGGCLGPEI